MERVSHCCHLMSCLCLLKERVVMLQRLRPNVILRCRIDSSWLADRQTGERPFSWMTHSVVLHYWDPETITLLSKCCHGHCSPKPRLGAACLQRGLSSCFMLYTIKLIGEIEKKEMNICLSLCVGAPSSITSSSMSHWSLISRIYVFRRRNGPYDTGHSVPWKSQWSNSLCKVFRNEITNAGFLFSVLTYIFSSHMLLIAETESYLLQ